LEEGEMKVVVASEKGIDLLFERFLDKVSHSTEAKDGADIPKRAVHYLAIQLKEDLKESGLL
jgi:hypothetical protein